MEVQDRLEVKILEAKDISFEGSRPNCFVEVLVGPDKRKTAVISEGNSTFLYTYVCLCLRLCVYVCVVDRRTLNPMPLSNYLHPNVTDITFFMFLHMQSTDSTPHWKSPPYIFNSVLANNVETIVVNLFHRNNFTGVDMGTNILCVHHITIRNNSSLLFLSIPLFPSCVFIICIHYIYFTSSNRYWQDLDSHGYLL